jgi:hypothetical protein
MPVRRRHDHIAGMRLGVEKLHDGRKRAALQPEAVGHIRVDVDRQEQRHRAERGRRSPAGDTYSHNNEECRQGDDRVPAGGEDGHGEAHDVGHHDRNERRRQPDDRGRVGMGPRPPRDVMHARDDAREHDEQRQVGQPARPGEPREHEREVAERRVSGPRFGPAQVHR